MPKNFEGQKEAFAAGVRPVSELILKENFVNFHVVIALSVIWTDLKRYLDFNFSSNFTK